MNIKIIYSITIVCCSTIVGFIFANVFIERVKLLGSVISTLQMLETEIVYGSTPLPILLKKVSAKSRRGVSNILLSVSNLLTQNEGYTFEELWSQTVISETKGSSFSKGDIELLLSIGNNLGVSNCEDQIKHIRLIQQEFNRNYEFALNEQSKNVKLFRNLGFLTGLALVIILY